MKKNLITYGLIVLLFGYSGTGRATSYSEADLGDLDMNGNTWIGALELGTNLILGNIHLNQGVNGFSSDWDAFNFTLPTDLIITSATISFTTDYNNANTSNGLIATARWDLREYNTSNTVASGNINDLLGVLPLPLFTSIPSLLPGRYTVYQSYNSGFPGDAWTADYTMKFEVADVNAPVPEAATMLLFGIGLLGLAGAGRRKKS